MTDAEIAAMMAKEPEPGRLLTDEQAAYFDAITRCHHSPPQPDTCGDCWLDAPMSDEERCQSRFAQSSDARSKRP